MLAIARALLDQPEAPRHGRADRGARPGHRRPGRGRCSSRIAEDEGIDVLVIEQNIGVATAVADRVAIMVNGRINRRDRRRASSPPTATCSSACSASAATATRTRRRPDRRRRRPGAAPPRPRQLPADQDLHLEPGAADPLDAAGAGRARSSSRRAPSPRALAARPGGAGRAPPARRAGRAGRARRRHARHQGRRASLHPRPDPRRRPAGRASSTSRPPARHSGAEIPAHQIAAYHPRGASGVFVGDRGEAVAGMTLAFERWVERQPGIAGIIAAGGSGGTAMVAAGDARAARRRAEAHRLDRRLAATSAPMSAPPTS